ncbi:hypothetical protein VNI00_006420 [Paramarasmius palmivorus]|uniref:Uncharacterized protein n=1 Tax=Paramarasmius palmivorus TaxID=297713 RepID=A0AAW0D9J8_9AGAR
MGASSTLGPSPFTAPNFLPTPESHSQPETSTPVGVPGSLPTGPTPHAPSRRNSQNVGYMPVTSEATRAQIKWLRKELDEDVDEEVKINLVVYLRKFDAQQRQLLAQIELAIVKQGDRVVEAVTGGPHDRIHDKELRQVWKDMGWRLLVPTTEFVLTLHDYFVSQHRDMYIFDAHLSRPPRLGSTTADVNKALSDAIAAAKKRTEDKWALKSLTVTNLQPIWEVFDADASGLLQWLAYWASGRHFAIWQYSQKISGILQDMHQLLRTRVLPLNRYAIDRYLHRMKTLNRVLSSTFPCDDPPQGELNQRVSTYTQKEEERMDRILSCLDYDIDGPDTIELITSRYHIERDFFPLIYLLLRRHLSLVRLACDVVFDGEEMNTPAQSLRNVFKAVKARVTLLETLFLQRGLNPLAQLSNFAFGMYHFVYQRYDPIFPLIEDKNDDVIAKISSAPVTRLKAGVHEVEAEPVFEGDADPIEFESCIGNGINGCWTGYFMDAEGADVLGLVRFRVSNWIEAVGAFDGTGMYGKGTLTVEGSYDLNDKILEAKFRTKGAPQLGDVGEEINIVVVGTLKAIVAGEPGSALQTQHTIHARWGHSEDSLNGRLYFSQTPAWVHLLRVSLGNQYPTEAHYKPAGWRWRFAIHAVRYRVRSQRGMLDPDGHCFIRLKLIRRAVALFKQQQLVGPLSIRAIEETENIQRALPPTLVNTCLWLARSSPWPTVHFNETLLTSETFCSICQKPGGPNGWWTCKLEEIRIKASQLVHRRDLNEFVNDAIAAERTAYQRYRSRPVDVSSFPLPSGFHPYSFTPFSPLSPISENSEEGEFTSTGFSSSPTEEKNMFPSHSPVSPSPASTPSSLALPDGRRRRVRFSTDDTTQTFSSRSSTPELLNSGVLLSCACCGAGLPNENGDAIWVCLVCSIVKTEELVGICTRCELLNRKGIAPHLAHRHDHTLVQIRPWHSPVGIDDYTAATPDGFTPRTPGTPYPSYPGRLPDAEYDKGPNYRTWSGKDLPPKRQGKGMRTVKPPLHSTRLNNLIYVLVFLSTLLTAYYSYRVVQWKTEVGGWWNLAVGRKPAQMIHETGTQRQPQHHKNTGESVEDRINALAVALGMPPQDLAKAIAGAVREYVPPASLTSIRERETAGPAVDVLLGKKAPPKGSESAAGGDNAAEAAKEGATGVVEGVMDSFVGMDEP